MKEHGIDFVVCDFKPIHLTFELQNYIFSD